MSADQNVRAGVHRLSPSQRRCLLDEEGSDDEWLAEAKQKGVRVRSQHGALVCVVAQDDLEKIEAIRISFMIWTRLRNEPSSLLLGQKPVHVEMLWTWQKTYEQCCVGVVIGVLTNGEWSACPSERSLTVRVCLIVWPKDARVLEDQGTALTVASLRERCSAGVGRDQKRSGFMWVPTQVLLTDGLTKSSAGVFLRKALTSGTAQLHEESTHFLKRKQVTSSSKRFHGVSVEPMDLKQKDWWQ